MGEVPGFSEVRKFNPVCPGKECANIREARLNPTCHLGWPCRQARLLLTRKDILVDQPDLTRTPQAGSSKPLCKPLAVSEQAVRKQQAARTPGLCPHHVIAQCVRCDLRMSSSDQGSMQNGVGEQQYERVPREGLQLAELNGMGVETNSVSSFEKLQPPRRPSRRANSRYSRRPTNLVAESCQVSMGNLSTVALHLCSQC